jgi:hypothetical protein
LLGYKREEVAEKDTQKILWKSAKKLLNNVFLTKMAEYNFMGPKPQTFEAY